MLVPWLPSSRGCELSASSDLGVLGGVANCAMAVIGTTFLLEGVCTCGAVTVVIGAVQSYCRTTIIVNVWFAPRGSREDSLERCHPPTVGSGTASSLASKVKPSGLLRCLGLCRDDLVDASVGRRWRLAPHICGFAVGQDDTHEVSRDVADEPLAATLPALKFEQGPKLFEASEIASCSCTMAGFAPYRNHITRLLKR